MTKEILKGILRTSQKSSVKIKFKGVKSNSGIESGDCG